MEMKRNVICPGCTCLCDDIQFSFDDQSLIAENACPIGQQWFQESPPVADCLIDGQSVELSVAIETAVKLIRQSSAPLICELQNLAIESQQSAWRLADQLGATIDTTLSSTGRGGMFALQRIGRVTATLGEVANRSDLVVFWFCDPAATHPRHLERYSHPRTGPSRKIIVVDERPTATANQADEFISMNRTLASQALSVMRANIAGEKRIATRCAEMGIEGLPLTTLQQLANQMAASRYGALFFGTTSQESQFDLETDLLMSFVRELNHKTRFVSLPLRSDNNAQGAENVLSWSSGFPFAVNLNRRFPRFNGLEYSAATILSRGECDLMILGSTGGILESLELLDSDALQHFEQTPKIILDEAGSINLPSARIQFSVSQPGKNIRGDFCRQDDVALPLQQLDCYSEAISATEVFDRLLEVK